MKALKELIKIILTATVCSVFRVDNISAQVDSIQNKILISGYLETYYVYDFASPSNNERPDFVYSFNRHNEVNLNLGLIKASYETELSRANLALMTGTYANANLALEPGVLKNIFESNAGVKISKRKNLWLDAGIFSSHIGFESAIGMDCPNLTRSILADNSPYFESGVKLSYESADTRWFFSGLVLNGWQTIQRIDGNNTPSFGHQLLFRPNSKITLNSSSFVGKVVPDSTRQMRYFHNFYALLNLGAHLKMIIGFDMGAQQKQKFCNDYSMWYAPIAIARYEFNKKISLAMRLEYYDDQDQVIVQTEQSYGFRTIGYSMNLDYAIEKNILWRIETRGFESKEPVFTKDERPVNQNYSITTSLAVLLNNPD